MADTLEYPGRPKFFALKYCRKLAKACVANEIGPEACWLLCVIAHTEDAKGYRGAVTFFNGQLQALVGCNSDDALNRLRAKAVRSGWLHYEAGGKGRAGRYWVVIPERHGDWDDAPTDEHDDDFTTAKVRDQAREKPGESADHSSLSLSQSTSLTPGPGPGECVAAGESAVGPNPDAVAAAWNTHPGLVPCRATNPHRDRVIRQWATGSPLWVEHWRAAIAYMGRTPFYCGAGERGWRADLSWLLKNDNFASVVERMLADGAPNTTRPQHDAQTPATRGAHAPGGGHRVEAELGKYERPTAGDGLQMRRKPAPAPAGPAGSPPDARGDAERPAVDVPGAGGGGAPVAAVPVEPRTG